MEVGVAWEVLPMQCSICKHQWVAVIEIKVIYWNKYTEYGYVEEVECPTCHFMNDVKRNDDEESE